MDYIKLRQELIEGKRFIYVMTRLYDFVEKIRGSMLETATIKGAKKAFKELGAQMTYFPTFLPFRDTREDEIVSDQRTRIIYDLDMKRLERLFGIVGSLDDPSKDDGICMELGYAAAKRVPTLVAVNDFIWYTSREINELAYVLDPVLLRIIGKVIYENRLPPSVSKHKDIVFKDMLEVKRDYYRRSISALRNTMQSILAEVYQMVMQPDSYVAVLPEPIQMKGTTVYLDFEGGKHEWQRSYMRHLHRLLSKKGYIVLESLRHTPHYQKQTYDDYGEGAIRILGETDIIHALSSDIVITCADGPEVDGGTAAIQGLARALNKQIIMYYSGNLEIRGDGGHRMIRNLMLQYSANATVERLTHIPKTVDVLAREVRN